MKKYSMAWYAKRAREWKPGDPWPGTWAFECERYRREDRGAMIAMAIAPAIAILVIGATVIAHFVLGR